MNGPQLYNKVHMLDLCFTYSSIVSCSHTTTNVYLPCHGIARHEYVVLALT